MCMGLIHLLFGFVQSVYSGIHLFCTFLENILTWQKILRWREMAAK